MTDLLDYYDENRRHNAAWSPSQLHSKGKEFFQWCRDNPRSKQVFDKNTGDTVNVDLPRSPTKEGLCLYLGITDDTLRNYGKREEYETVVKTLTQMIHEEQITGGMVDTYNANLVARYTGLSDKQQVEQTTSIDVSSKTDLQDELNKLIGKQERTSGDKVADSKDDE